MLYLIATPIGSIDEISERALKILKSTELIICESTKETSKLLKSYGISGKKYELLNEHSTSEDLLRLIKICELQDAALVSDCGTPGFCDPGNDLVKLCRKHKIQVRSVLGPSSLMGLLSLTSEKINEFVFRGFLSADNELRLKEIKTLQKESRAIVLMDTPYRLKKIMHELESYFNDRKILLAINLSQDSEQILEGRPKEISSQIKEDKAEFMILIYPSISKK